MFVITTWVLFVFENERDALNLVLPKIVNVLSAFPHSLNINACEPL